MERRSATRLRYKQDAKDEKEELLTHLQNIVKVRERSSTHLQNVVGVQEGLSIHFVGDNHCITIKGNDKWKGFRLLEATLKDSTPREVYVETLHYSYGGTLQLVKNKKALNDDLILVIHTKQEHITIEDFTGTLQTADGRIWEPEQGRVDGLIKYLHETGEGEVIMTSGTTVRIGVMQNGLSFLPDGQDHVFVKVYKIPHSVAR
jgi:hypothetical protein